MLKASGLILAPLLVLSVSLPARSADDNAPVSNDGKALQKQRIVVTTERGYAGTLSGGEADATFANAPAGTDTDSDFAVLLRKKTVGAPDAAESVIGADTRKRVNPTTTYPARANVLITFGEGRCSGWMIGADTVVTAGHCVHSGGPGGKWYATASYTVYPGKNGRLSPYGSCTVRRLYSVSGWTRSGRDDFDYGALKLNCKIGNTVGYFGFFTTKSDLVGTAATITGYPGDKPLTEWTSSDEIKIAEETRLYYAIDTYGGNSGSPVYYRRPGCGYCGMAIHNYGVFGDGPNGQYNHGTRINSDVFANLQSWKSAR